MWWPLMKKSFLVLQITFLILFLAFQATALAAKSNEAPKSNEKKTDIGINQNVTDNISRQVVQVRKELASGAKSLLKREPLGFDWQTAEHLYSLILSAPRQLPTLMQRAVEQSRLLGVVGTLIVLTFLIALIYSFLGQKRVMARVEERVAPLQELLPPKVYPLILSAIRVVVAALFPLVLLAVYTLIHAVIAYDAAWFHLTGQLLKLWAAGNLVISLLRELLTRDLFSGTVAHGKSLFRLSRLVVLYSLFGIGLLEAAQAFELRQDILALVQFIVSLSIVLVLFLLLLKKRAFLSLLPDLPQPSYIRFRRILERFYFPLILFSWLLALLWSIGFRSLGSIVLIKIWSSGAAYLIIMAIYNLLLVWLERWYAGTDKEDEAARLLFRSFKSLLVYSVAILTVLIVLNLLGLLYLLEQSMSFPVFQIGQSSVTLWVMVKAALILVAFIFLSRVLQAYLEYKVYPVVGIEPGLGYALNTFLNYLLLAVGVLVALNVVGLDLRFLLVFAGAIGIGIGIGLQSIAANIISGFALIFGGKLRKGDWIEVSGTMGVVTDIFLHATKIRTRENIEYLIPNNSFITGILVNYTLDSPLIRIDVPVGVSYNADPKHVEKILLEAARRERTVSREKPAVVRFVAFGESSLDFHLMVWIDVRTTARKLVRSSLYFAIFDDFKKAGIEIPFPQRDLHIRSTVAGETQGKKDLA